jgi:hypothetical protein
MIGSTISGEEMAIIMKREGDQDRAAKDQSRVQADQQVGGIR